MSTQHNDVQGAQWQEEVVARLIAEAETAPHRAERVQMLQQAAEIYDVHISDPEKALVVWQAAFLQDFCDERSAHAVERLAERLGAGRSLLDQLRAVAAQEGDPTQKAALLAWLGRWTARFGDDVAPPRPAAGDRLEALVSAERWPESVQAIEAEARRKDPLIRSKYLTLAAKIRHQKLQRIDEAVQTLDRALDACLANVEAVDLLYDLLAEAGRWRDAELRLLKLIARAHGEEEKPAILAAAWSRLAEVYQAGLDDAASATSARENARRWST